VQDLLCGPKREELPTDVLRKQSILEAAKRNARSFSEMVENIMAAKQLLERERQRAAV